MRYYNKLLILALLAGLSSGCGTTSSTDNQQETQTHTNRSLPTVGWYMRITAYASTLDGKVYTHNSAGVFGELDESQDGLDQHDVPAKGKAILQVRLVNENLDSTKEYYSDYRSYDIDKTKESWDFVVINDDSSVDLSNASLNIDIENLKNIYKQNNKYKEVASSSTTKRDSIKIIDLDNQIVYTYDELKNANLSMDNKHTRKFRLVLGEVTQEDMQTFTTGIQSRSYIPRTFTKGFGLPPE